MTPTGFMDPPDPEREWLLAYRRLRDRYSTAPGFDDDGASFREACRITGYTPEHIEEEDAD